MSHEDRVEETNHLFPPAGYSPFNVVQDTAGLLGSKCLLLAQFQLFVHQNPLNLLHRTAPNELMSGIAPTRVQHLALGLEAHEVLAGPLLKFVNCTVWGPIGNKIPKLRPCFMQRGRTVWKSQDSGYTTQQASTTPLEGYVLKPLS